MEVTIKNAQADSQLEIGDVVFYENRSFYMVMKDAHDEYALRGLAGHRGLIGQHNSLAELNARFNNGTHLRSKIYKASDYVLDIVKK